jgi:hypothetical protein
MINKIIKNIRYKFSSEYAEKKRQQQLEDFLSQAIDRVHLEYLMAEWDRKNKSIY